MTKEPSSKNAIAWTASLGMFMAVLDGVVVNVALTPMAQALHTNLSDIQWVITGYLLALAAVIPLAGYLGQRFGLKRVFIVSQLLFVAGSVACGLSSELGILIFFRVIQAIGGGALFPLAQAIALRAFPPQQRANASAIIGLSALVAPALGPTVGGLLTDGFGWQAIFFINLPVGLIAVFLAWLILPADHNTEAATSQRRFDYMGLLLSIFGVLAVVYALSLVTQTQPGTVSQLRPQGDIYGWSYWLVWVLLGVGLALLGIFAVYELRFSADPVLDLRLFKRYGFTTSTLVCSLVSVAVFGSLFLLPVWLEMVHTPHLSATEAGLTLLPQGIASAVGVVLSGRFLYNRWGVRNLVVIGAILLIVGTLGLTNLQPDTDIVGLLPWLVLRGLGFGWTFVTTQTRALQELTGPALGKGSSLLNVLRQISASVGTAIVSTLFTQQTAQHASDLRAALPAGTVLSPQSPAFQTLTARAGTLAVNDVLGIVAIGSVVILVVALTLRSHQPDAATPTATPEIALVGVE